MPTIDKDSTNENDQNEEKGDDLIFNVGDMVAGYRISEKIDEGGFGQVFKVTKDGGIFAMKIESSAQEGGSAIKLEMDVLTDLKNRKVPNFPILFDGGRRVKYHYIVMELLGENIKSLRFKCPNPEYFSPGTWSRIAIQCLYVIKLLHDNGFVHRDIKPSNFALGSGDIIKGRMIYLFDFGLARRFVLRNKPSSELSNRKAKDSTYNPGMADSHREKGSLREKKASQKPTNNKKKVKNPTMSREDEIDRETTKMEKLVPKDRQLEQPIQMYYRFRIARAHTDFRGTMQYASPNAHAKIELGRADDIFSLMYMLIEMIVVLPWTGNDIIPIEKQKGQAKLGEMFKNGVSSNSMKKETITHVTESFIKIEENLQSCNYYMSPDYELIYQCFKEIMDKEGTTWMDPYDWETNESPLYLKWKEEKTKQKINHVWENPRDFFRRDGWASLSRPSHNKKDQSKVVKDADKSIENKTKEKNLDASLSGRKKKKQSMTTDTETAGTVVFPEEGSKFLAKLFAEPAKGPAPTTTPPPTVTHQVTETKQNANTNAATPSVAAPVNMRRTVSTMAAVDEKKPKKSTRNKKKPAEKTASVSATARDGKFFKIFKSKTKKEKTTPAVPSTTTVTANPPVAATAGPAQGTTPAPATATAPAAAPHP